VAQTTLFVKVEARQSQGCSASGGPSEGVPAEPALVVELLLPVILWQIRRTGLRRRE